MPLVDTRMVGLAPISEGLSVGKTHNASEVLRCQEKEGSLFLEGRENQAQTEKAVGPENQ